jgi:hypothetical protein
MCSKRSWHVKAVLGSKRRATLLDATSSGACTIAALTENPTMRIVLAPDSFKGSLTAREVCDALSRGLARAMPDVEIVARPMADGGEGTLDAVLAAVGAHTSFTTADHAAIRRHPRYKLEGFIYA